MDFPGIGKTTGLISALQMKKQVPQPDLKVRFSFYSEQQKKDVTEELAATLLDKFAGFYVIDSIPEQVSKVASDDVVCARFDKKENILIFHHIVQHSGNSVIRVQLTNSKEDFKAIRNEFIDLGCFSEKISQFYFSMEVPADLDYIAVKEKLEELKLAGTISYSELLLSEKHGGTTGADLI